jgi:hypothetical protein
MTVALYVAAALMIGVGIAHSYLGERYLLMRLFRRGELPKLFGGTEFTARTLRFAWHVTSIAWWGFAAVFVLMAHPPMSFRALGIAIAVPLLATAAMILIASRGRHLAWPVFLVAGSIALQVGG